MEQSYAFTQVERIVEQIVRLRL